MSWTAPSSSDVLAESGSNLAQILLELKTALNERQTAIGVTNTSFPTIAGSNLQDTVGTYITTLRTRIADLLSVDDDIGFIAPGFCKSDFSNYANISAVLTAAGHPSGWITDYSVENVDIWTQFHDVFSELVNYKVHESPTLTTEIGARTHYGKRNFATSWESTSDLAWGDLVGSPTSGNSGYGADPWQGGLHLGKHSPHWTVSHQRSFFIDHSVAQECWEATFNFPSPGTNPGSMVNSQIGIGFKGSPEFTSSVDFGFDGNTKTVFGGQDSVYTQEWYTSYNIPGNITMTLDSSLPGANPFNVSETPPGTEWGHWSAVAACSCIDSRYLYALSIGNGLTYG